ncbi:hypothetical protein Pan44_52550 [Caulifigura coniformis]|uniref:Uncharacterized protein n=1 Tax=Caulifigura coniformis TaxID=2527983 RepID=A0A517SM58_9PLAN|nr:hypothetical protein Pan44_52550 [Caulifigura coniformis]
MRATGWAIDLWSGGGTPTTQVGRTGVSASVMTSSASPGPCSAARRPAPFQAGTSGDWRHQQECDDDTHRAMCLHITSPPRWSRPQRTVLRCERQ